MNKAAKLLLIDREDNYLLLYRNNHPYFGDDPDLPGGTVQKGEELEEAVIREAKEEIGVIIDEVTKVYAGLKYSLYGTYKALYAAHVNQRPDITLSWEHLSYEWLPKDEFLNKIKDANDTYMHMVYKVLSKK